MPDAPCLGRASSAVGSTFGTSIRCIISGPVARLRERSASSTGKYTACLSKATRRGTGACRAQVAPDSAADLARWGVSAERDCSSVGAGGVTDVHGATAPVCPDSPRLLTQYAAVEGERNFQVGNTNGCVVKTDKSSHASRSCSVVYGRR